MITKMNYLLLSTMMIAAMENTFGRCCLYDVNLCQCYMKEKTMVKNIL